MVTFDALNSHFEYMDVVRHWSPISQKYAGGDVVLTLLSDDWEIDETVFYEEYWHAGSRPVTIYHMKMVRDGEQMNVPVFVNPYIRRIVHDSGMQLRPLTERRATRQHS